MKKLKKVLGQKELLGDYSQYNAYVNDVGEVVIDMTNAPQFTHAIVVNLQKNTFTIDELDGA